MFIQSIKMQLKVIYEKKVAMCILLLLFAVMLTNYFTNVMTYRGTDLVDMYHPMKLLSLSSHVEYSFYIMQYFPLIVVIPAGFSLYADRQLNQLIYIQARVGARHYYWGKLVVVFLVTFFVFTVPFLTEILLNSIAFPISATGDPSNFSMYNLVDLTSMYLFADLYIEAPYLYAVFSTLLFGVISGLLAVFTVAISTFPIKFKVLLFLPIYLLLYLVGMLNQLFSSLSITTNYFFYLRFYQAHYNPTGSLRALIAFMAIILALSLGIVVVKIRKDTL